MLSIGGIGLLAAFAAGLASFISPCVFPLVPGYLAYLAGTAGDTAPAQRRWFLFLHAASFVLGFSLIFIMLGATASTIGQTLAHHISAIRRVAGFAVIAFGALMVLAYIAPIPALTWLYRERRAEVHMGSVSFWRSGLIGFAFGAGWTPCVGPLLGSIITLAAVNTSLGQGVLLLSVYALGLGMPFLLAGLALDRATGFVRRFNRYTGPISIAAGVLLMGMGVLMVSGALAQLAQFAPVWGG